MAALAPERVREIESLVTDWMDDGSVPGTSVVLVDADGERYAEGFGARDVETNAPATPATLYGAGSITKSVTGLACCQLAEADALSLSDPVDEHVDHFSGAPGDPITVAELLSHTSGMPATDPGILTQALDGIPSGVADEADRERFLRDAVGWRVTDEDRFMYYNTGYDVLGRVIEAVDGRSYATYVREEVFDPLGMDRSTFDADAFADEDDAMTGYVGDEDAPEPTPFPFDELFRPSGGLLSSVRELGRFLRAMLGEGSLEGARVATADTVERLHRPRATRQTYLDGTEERYGYGWMRQPLAGDELLGHGGSVAVSTAYAGFLREAGLGVAVACNTTPDLHPAELGMAILAVATGAEPTAVPAYALAEKCEAVTGTYESYRGEMTVTVERDEGGISLAFDGSLGGFDIVAYPTSLAPDEYEFEAVEVMGARTPVEFDPSGERADLFFRRNRFRRVQP